MKQLSLAWQFVLASLLIGAPAYAAESIIVQDWPKTTGADQIPEGWNLRKHKGDFIPGDISVEKENGRSVLRLKANNRSYFLGKENLRIPLSQTPILRWSWKTKYPLKGADCRNANTDDQPVDVYVIFHPDKEGNTRSIGYMWDYNAPRCVFISSPSERSWVRRTALRAAGVPITWYVVLRNRETPLNTWITESRDVAADYRKVFRAQEVPDVQSVAIQIDTASLKGNAESWVGSIRFLSEDDPKAETAKPSGEAPPALQPPCTSLKEMKE